MNRYDKFLSKYLPIYLTMDLIDEIIICDETGEDVKKIKENFNSPKLKLHVNEKRLGVFFNKRKVALLAKNEWVCVFDSDNFPEKNYFKNMKRYIDNDLGNQKNVILSPCYAKDGFLFHYLAGWVITKETLKDAIKEERSDPNRNLRHRVEVLMNMMNGVYNKHIFEQMDVETEKELILTAASSDSILFTIFAFEQLDAEFHVVNGVEYDHVVHDDSFWLIEYNSGNAEKYAKIINDRWLDLVYTQKCVITDTEYKRYGFGNKTHVYPKTLSGLTNESVVYCVGAGDNVLHDIEVAHQTGAHVHIFDPHPKALEHIHHVKKLFANGGLSSDHVLLSAPYSDYVTRLMSIKIPHDKIHSHSCGVATNNSSFAKFYQHDNTDDFSHSLVKNTERDVSMFIATKSLSTIMKEEKHRKIDFLSINAPGVVGDIIEDMLAKDIPLPPYLSVVFDDCWNCKYSCPGKKKLMDVIASLQKVGYTICHPSELATNTSGRFTFLLM
jgi:hypothetical protein